MRAEHLALVTGLRHELHAHPELSLRETETAARIERFLREHTSFRIVARDGWLCAVRAGTDPSAGAVAFRAELDALPIDEGIELAYASECEGVSHKCGHDGHCAALCGLALMLEGRAPERTVYLIFQPGEEIGAGGERCAAFVKEEGIDEVYAFHNFSGYPEGTVVYRRGLTQPASEGLSIRLTGRASHASEPEKGKNPAAAVARIALHAQGLCSAPGEGMVMCTITGMRVGTGDFGVSPGDGEIRMTLRAEAETDMKALEAELLRFAAAEAAAEGLSAEHDIADYFPETRNDGACLDRVVRAAEGLEYPVREMDGLWRASEDFGYYTKVCPGAVFYIGSGENHPPLHTREYDFNDRLIPLAAELLAELI